MPVKGKGSLESGNLKGMFCHRFGVRPRPAAAQALKCLDVGVLKAQRDF